MIHFDLKLNDKVIGTCEIVRILTNTSIDPDSINLYQYTFINDENVVTDSGRIEHKYGDDAWILLTKALAHRIQRTKVRKLEEM